MSDKETEICDPDSGDQIILATALERDAIGDCLDSLLNLPSKESFIASAKEKSFTKSFWNNEFKDKNDERWFQKADDVIKIYSTQYDEFIGKYTQTEIRMMYTMREKLGDDVCLKLFDVENIESHIPRIYTEEGIKQKPPSFRSKQTRARNAFLARLKPQRERQLELAQSMVHLCNLARNFQGLAKEKSHELIRIYVEDTIDIKDKLQDAKAKKLSDKAPKISLEKGIELEKRRQQTLRAPSRVHVLTRELNAMGLQEFDCARKPRAPPELYFSLDDIDEFVEWQRAQRKDNADMPEMDPMEIVAFAELKDQMKELLSAKDYDPKKIPATMYHLLREEILEAPSSDDDFEYESESDSGEEEAPKPMRFVDPPKPDKHDIGLRESLERDIGEIIDSGNAITPETRPESVNNFSVDFEPGDPEYSEDASMEDDSEAQTAIDDSVLSVTSFEALRDEEEQECASPDSPDAQRSAETACQVSVVHDHRDKPSESKPSRPKARILAESPPPSPQPRERDLTPPPKRPRTPTRALEDFAEELNLQRKKAVRTEKKTPVKKAKKAAAKAQKMIPATKIKKELDSIDFVVPHFAAPEPAPPRRKPKTSFPPEPHVQAVAATALHRGFTGERVVMEPHFPEKHTFHILKDPECILETIDQEMLADDMVRGVEKMRAKLAVMKTTLLVAPPKGTLVRRKLKNAECYGVNELRCPSSDIPFPAVVLQTENRRAASATEVFKQAKVGMTCAIDTIVKEHTNQSKTLVVGDDIIAHLNPAIIQYGQMVKVCGPASVMSALCHLQRNLRDVMRQLTGSFEIHRVVWIFSYEYFHRSIAEYKFEDMVVASVNAMERVFGPEGYMANNRRLDHWEGFDSAGYTAQPTTVTFVTIPEFGSFKGKFRLINTKLSAKVKEYMARRNSELEPIFEILDWAAAAEGMKTVAERAECLVGLLNSVGVLTHVYDVNAPPQHGKAKKKTKRKKF